jgi:hypothetical protein
MSLEAVTQFGKCLTLYLHRAHAFRWKESSEMAVTLEDIVGDDKVTGLAFVSAFRSQAAKAWLSTNCSVRFSLPLQDQTLRQKQRVIHAVQPALVSAIEKEVQIGGGGGTTIKDVLRLVAGVQGRDSGINAMINAQVIHTLPGCPD